MMDGRRESRIDLIRGLALLLIFVGHSQFTFSQAVQQSRGFADASELFVMLAGMSAALAYGAGRPGAGPIPVRRILSRAGRLYLVHLALVFGLLALVLLPCPGCPGGYLVGENAVLAVWQVADLRHAPLPHAFEALTLRYMPGDFDILPLYVALMAALPAILLVERRSAILLLAASAAIWLGAGAGHLNLTNFAQDKAQWFFDPLSWQFVFVLGLLLGARIKRGLDPFAYRPRLFVAAAAFALVCIPANLVLQFTAAGRDFALVHHGLTAVFASKSFEGALRLLDALAILYVLWNLDWMRRLGEASLTGPVRAAGRHSLPVFAAGLVLSTLLQALMARVPDLSLGLQIALMAIGCLLQLELAVLLEKRRITLRKGRLASASPAS